jgi:hypothetical protein
VAPAANSGAELNNKPGWKHPGFYCLPVQYRAQLSAQLAAVDNNISVELVARVAPLRRPGTENQAVIET